MTKLEKKLRQSWRRLHIDAGAAIVVAVSGGADSTALLDALVRLSQREGASGRLLIAHLNHQLRGEEADEDEQFVRALAARLQLPVFVERADVFERARAAKENLEATARQLRYDFLRRVAEENLAAYVLTAHTQDDQAETILMRLLRGSGAAGLQGVARVRPLSASVKLLRPLLDVTRAQVLEHCQQYGLEFRTDSSNFSAALLRNRVRHELLPVLRTFNPRAPEALARAAELFVQDEDYLQSAAGDLLAASVQDAALDVTTLQHAPAALQRRTLRLWLRARLGSLRRIEAAHIAAIERLLTQSQSGRSINLPGGGQVAREFDKLRFSLRPPHHGCRRLLRSLTDGAQQPIGDYELMLRRKLTRAQAAAIIAGLDAHSYHARLREGVELNEILVRGRAAGDAYVPVGRNHLVKLKTLLIRHKIPRSERADHPLLVTADERIIWAPGLPVARAFAWPDDDEAAVGALVIAQRSSGVAELAPGFPT